MTTVLSGRRTFYDKSSMFPVRGASVADRKGDAYYNYDHVDGEEEQSEEDDALRQRRKTKPPDAVTVKEGEAQIGADSGSEYEYDGPRNESYIPHPGFEMYWPNGDWVLPSNYFPATTSLHTTTISSTARDPKNLTRWYCGRVCPQKYIDYGPICARNGFGNKQYDFENYCEFYQQDCERGRGWYIAYRGRCDRQSGFNKYKYDKGGNAESAEKTFYNFLKNRADALIYNFMATSPSTTTLPRITPTVAAFAGVDEDSDSDGIDEFTNLNRTLTDQEQRQKNKLDRDRAAKQKFRESMACYIMH